jgi:hypothetical protein
MMGYHGGQTVKGGCYLKFFTWQFVSIASEGGVLPGDKETRYGRLPLPVLMFSAPLIGLAYIVFSPTIYCLTSLYCLARLIGYKFKLIKAEG